MIGPTIWHQVEKSGSHDNCYVLEKASRHGIEIYRILINWEFDNYYYNSNDAFNALERWEVRQGILPKTYKPEKI